MELTQELIDQSHSMWDLCQKLGYTNRSGNTYSLVRRKIKELKLVEKNLSNTRKKWKVYSNEEIYCQNSTYDKKTLRQRIIKENKIPYCCNECGISSWNNNPLSLQLDHINGINDDNRLENLRFLCPNCHSQTLTWGSKNAIMKFPSV